MIAKRFDLIEKSDIDALLENEVREGRALDYKQELPGNSDSEKKEFLADVSSLTNAGGGDIVFGISEKQENGKNTGIPNAVVGLPNLNADAEILRLETVVRNGIDPRIPGVQTKPIAGFPSGSVLLLRVPRSWAAPHMVTYQGTSRFFSRTSAGKYPLDVREIRSAFLLSENLAEGVKRFRDERLGHIVADETPVPLKPCAKAVLHLLPLSTSSGVTMDFARLTRTPQILFLSLPAKAYDGYNHFERFNFDGFLQWNMNGSPNAIGHSYVQYFRNGGVEAVETLTHYENFIPSFYVPRITEAIQRMLGYFRGLSNLEPPFVILLSFIGVKGYELMVPGVQPVFGQCAPIDRDVLILPDILIESYEDDVREAIRPALDALWQASGYADRATAV